MMEALRSAELKIGKPNLEVFSETLLGLARQDRDILVVTGDSRGSGKLTTFGEQLPGQIIEVGIAEQGLVGVAAGLASAGKKVFAVSPACFLTARALEQIKNDVAYSDHSVKLVGISAGVSYGALGTTHHSLHDLAALQAIHNIDIVIPADNFETRAAIEASLNHPRPLYIRLGKKAMPELFAPGALFQIGKAISLSEGNDLTIIACGETVYPAFLASQILTGEGISCGVMSMHTVKPLDEAAVRAAAARSRALITVEEHSIHGGLGSRVAALLMQAGLFRPVRIVGIPDEHTVTGSQVEILNHYGISAEGLAATAQGLLQASATLSISSNR
jgi:transketolase